MEINDDTLGFLSLKVFGLFIVFIFIVIFTTFRPICHPAFFKCLSDYRCLSNSGTFTKLRTTSFIESTTFRPICPPAFFRCLSNSGTYTELRNTSFIESTGFASSDSVNRVQVLSLPVFLHSFNKGRKGQHTQGDMKKISKEEPKERNSIFNSSPK